MITKEVRRGAGIYSKPVLGFYDALVVQFSNTHVWRCPSPLMLAQYDSFMGKRHLEVGPGTGWYLEHATLPADVDITLMDLNNNSLSSASRRLGDTAHRALIANVLEELPAAAGPFDSIGINYVLHCVPGTWDKNGIAFRHLGARLTDDGVLFGSTILGSGVHHSRLGRGFMGLYNRLGIFHNREDDAAGLRRVLHASFEEVTVEVTGTVAVFNARRPIRQNE